MHNGLTIENAIIIDAPNTTLGVIEEHKNIDRILDKNEIYINLNPVFSGSAQPFCGRKKNPIIRNPIIIMVFFRFFDGAWISE